MSDKAITHEDLPHIATIEKMMDRGGPGIPAGQWNDLIEFVKHLRITAEADRPPVVKRIKYRREYDVTIIEEYTADVPEHLLDDDSSLGRASLDQYVSDNFVPYHKDRQGMTEDSLSCTFTVLGNLTDENPGGLYLPTTTERERETHV